MQPTPYVPPAIKVAGDASQIVMGLGFAGGDIRGEYLVGGTEFLDDESPESD